MFWPNQISLNGGKEVQINSIVNTFGDAARNGDFRANFIELSNRWPTQLDLCRLLLEILQLRFIWGQVRFLWLAALLFGDYFVYILLILVFIVEICCFRTLLHYINQSRIIWRTFAIWINQRTALRGKRNSSGFTILSERKDLDSHHGGALRP